MDRIEYLSEHTIALVTGANKGIGYKIAAGLGALSWSVGVGARDQQRREAAVQKLREAGVNAFGVPLDVTDEASVAAAVGLVEGRAGRIDVLVNNAGVTGGMPQLPSTVDLTAVRTALETNVIGVIRVTNAMLPLLRRSPSPRIVNMSSSVGSLTLQTTPDAETGPISVAYCPSKTCLNAVTVQYAKELRDTNILINAACPGYTATDLNGFRGLRTPEQGGPSRSISRPCPTTAQLASSSTTPGSFRGDPWMRAARLLQLCIRAGRKGLLTLSACRPPRCTPPPTR